MNDHKETAHGIACEDKRRVLKCRKCDYESKHGSNYSRHGKIYENDVGSCKYCNRPFCNIENVDQQNRRNHMQRMQIKEHSKPNKGQGLSAKLKFDRGENGLRTKIKTRDVKGIFESTGSKEKRFGTMKRTCETYMNDKKDETTPHYGANNFAKNSNINKIYDSNRYNIKRKSRARGKTNQIKKKTHTSMLCIDKDNYSGTSVESGDEECIRTKKTTTAKSDTGTFIDLNAQKCKLLSCAFCEFKAYSMRELRNHLDEHDYGIDITDLPDSEKVSHSELNPTVSKTDPSDSKIDQSEQNDIKVNDKLFFSESNCGRMDYTSQSSKCYNDESVSDEATCFSLDYNDLTNTNVLIDGASNMFLIRTELETSNETNDKAILFPKEKDESDSQHVNEDFNEDYDEPDHSKYFKAQKVGANDKMDINLNENDSEFIMRPFACSKCMFATGNLEFLKIHVEAHLYDAVRVSNCAETQIIKSKISSVISRRASRVLNGRKTQTEMCDLEKFEDKNTHTTEHIALHRETDLCNVNQSADSVKEQNESNISCSNLIGRLKKNDFKKNKKCYTKHTINGRTTFECLICNLDNDFLTRTEIKEHFRNRHKELREKVCKTCHYCSKPFPK